MIYELSSPKEVAFKVIQDPIHICTKARNRLLKSDIKLPLGTHDISINHLKNLVKNVQKSIHGLTYSDVFPIDRMNYDSFDKLVQDRVLISLKESVPGSEATIQYLRTFRDIASGFSEFDMKPLDRINRVWRGIFFLRIWRKFLKNSRSYNLSDNFITNNTYMCVEINAEILIRLIENFRDRNLPEFFLPALFNSQTCESTFRIFRSMGTTQFTKINFCLSELIHMIGRIEVQNDISYCKLSIDGIELPHKRKSKTTIYQLPTNEEIRDTIEKARTEAFQIAEKFGITNSLSNLDQIDKFEFKSKLNLNEIDKKAGEEMYDDELDDDITEKSDNYNDSFEEHFENDNEINEIELMDTDPNFGLDTASRFTYIIDENDRQKLVLKSSLLWMLTESKTKMSNDRTKRFKFNST